MFQSSARVIVVMVKRSERKGYLSDGSLSPRSEVTKPSGTGCGTSAGTRFSIV
jgi:hypothetical protein